MQIVDSFVVFKPVQDPFSRFFEKLYILVQFMYIICYAYRIKLHLFENEEINLISSFHLIHWQRKGFWRIESEQTIFFLHFRGHFNIDKTTSERYENICVLMVRERGEKRQR